MPRHNRPKRPQRRVNPHKAPWDSYPILVFTPDDGATAAREAEHRKLRTAGELFNRDTPPRHPVRSPR